MNVKRFFNLDYICYMLLISMVGMLIQNKVSANWQYCLGFLLGIITQTINFINIKKTKQQ